MRVDFVKGSKEQKMFMEFWELCQDFWDVEKSDDYWKSFMDRAKEFGMKYQPLSRDLANALRNYLLNKGGIENEETGKL